MPAHHPSIPCCAFVAPAPASLWRVIVYILLLGLTAGLALLVVGKIDMVVKAEGSVIPEGGAQVVEALVPGEIVAWHVAVGDSVEPGTIIAELRSPSIGQRVADRDRAVAALERARTDAEENLPERLAGYDAQVAAIDRQITATQAEIASIEASLAASQALDAIERERLQAALTAAEARREAEDEDYEAEATRLRTLIAETELTILLAEVQHATDRAANRYLARQSEAEVREAEAEVLRTQALARQAQRDLDAQFQLFDTGDVTAEEVDDARDALAVAEAQVEIAASTLAALQAQRLGVDASRDRLVATHALTQAENRQLLAQHRSTLGERAAAHQAAVAELHAAVVDAQAEVNAQEHHHAIEIQTLRQLILARETLIGEFEENRAAVTLARQADVASVQATLVEARANVQAAADAVAPGLIREGNRVLVPSPVEGQVSYRRSERANEVVQAGDTLARIAPREASPVLRVWVSNDQIGPLQAGLEAAIHYYAYPYQRYGSYTGSVRWVSPEPQISGPHAGAYEVIIAPESPMVGKGQPRQVPWGVEAEIAIVTERRRLFEVFLTPLNRFGDGNVVLER